MNITPAKTPLLVKKIFSNYVWDVDTKTKELFLTFDDGPTPKVTEWVLNTLQQFDAKATFFCIGDNVAKYPDIFQKILEHGHVIGNHTNNHLNGWDTSTTDYLKNVVDAQKIISQQSTGSNFFRPPYGRLKPKQRQTLIEKGYKIIMWSVLSFDWDKNTSEETCLSNIKKHAKQGSIIVFHDSLKAQNNLYYALPKSLEYFKKRGFVFKSLK